MCCITYSAFFGYFHFPHTTFGIAFFFPVYKQGSDITNDKNDIMWKQMLFLRFSSPEWFSFSSHQMIAPSQWQAGDPRYVVVNSPKVLLQSKGEERKWVILLNHLPTHRVQTFGLDDILQWPKRTSSLLLSTHTHW